MAEDVTGAPIEPTVLTERQVELEGLLTVLRGKQAELEEELEEQAIEIRRQEGRFLEVQALAGYSDQLGSHLAEQARVLAQQEEDAESARVGEARDKTQKAREKRAAARKAKP